MTRLVAEGLAIAERLQPTNLEARSGERIALIGPNGSGKTSLLHALAGIGNATGTVRLDDADLSDVHPARRARLLGYLPASRDAVWPVTVHDAVRDTGATADEAAAVLAALDLERLALRPLDRLSTGERARAFLARALAPRPPLVLADEPTANLDPRWRLRVAALLREAAEAGSIVVMSVHDLDAALAWGTRLLVLDGGSVVADGTPADVTALGVIEAVFGVCRADGGWDEIQDGGVGPVRAMPAHPRSSR